VRIAVLGTGTVGRTLAGKLRELGHEVTVGSRTEKDDAVEFADAAGGAELVVNATAGTASLEALHAAGAENLAGKVLLDVSNSLDFSRGRPPRLSVCNDDSVGEQIQREFPETRVVKSLNTVNSSVMVDPSLVPGEHSVFVSGNDDGAKAQIRELLLSFGWPESSIVDLGDISTARGAEMYVALWLRLFAAVQTPNFNIRVVPG
jgi:8-hydroxy-5-deazaflavin:NADPH oxidoreductase